MVTIADVFPDEGLDALLAIVPKNGSNYANLFVGLFTYANGTTVPASNALLSGLAGAGTGGFAETSVTLWSTYTRMTHAAGSWGAAAASTVWSTVGRIVNGSQVSFAAPTGGAYSPASPIAGFFLASLITAGIALYYSNFSDGSTIASLQIGDVVKVTPAFGFGN